jgi:hypothetical protein
VLVISNVAAAKAKKTCFMAEILRVEGLLEVWV